VTKILGAVLLGSVLTILVASAFVVRDELEARRFAR